MAYLGPIVICAVLAYPAWLLLWVCWLIFITSIFGGWKKAKAYNPEDLRRIRDYGSF